MLAHLICIASGSPNDASALQSAISALESDIAVLERSSGYWELLLPLFTLLVAIGVAIEIVVIRRDHDEDLEEWRVCKLIPDKPSSSKLRWELASVVLVTVGILGELGIGLWISHVNGQLRTKSAALRNKSDHLIAIITEGAEHLRQDAEHERLQRAKIEASVAWRRLTGQQKNEIGISLKRFSNQGVSFWSNSGDTEAAMFTADIAEAVKKAYSLRVYAPAQFMKMLEGGPANLGKPIERIDTGVIVVYTNDAPSLSLANAISHELNVRGFDARTRKNTGSGTAAPQVWVNVEPRPEGPQGEYKLQAEQDAKVESKSGVASKLETHQ